MCIWGGGALALGSGQHSEGPFPPQLQELGNILGHLLNVMTCCQKDYAQNVTVRYQQVSDDPSRT